jgi:glutamate 5-kinase
MHAGKQIVLVSSGAVGMGMRKLGWQHRPQSLGLRQACAAVGQGDLVGLYTQIFSHLRITTAQVLLTQGDRADQERALCLRTTLMRLLELRALPILNENDSVSVRELVDRAGDGGFGDNDGLSARVAATLSADLMVLLSDVDGVYDQDPRHAGAVRIEQIEDASRPPVDLGKTSSMGTGGIISKFKSAELATSHGTAAVVAGGATPRVLHRLLAGEPIGTLFLPSVRRTSKHRHIAVVADSQGALVANAGALQAVCEQKASLLPVGVIDVIGHFGRGDIVEVRDGHGKVYARGLVNYDSAACRLLAGKHSSEIEHVLGYRGYSALITRVNMVVP